jgi:hypothetical protein
MKDLHGEHESKTTPNGGDEPVVASASDRTEKETGSNVALAMGAKKPGGKTLAAAKGAMVPYKAELRSGKLVVCKNCGLAGPDFNMCLVCKKKIPEGSKVVDEPAAVLAKEPYKAELRSGKLVVCKNCGLAGPDFNMCLVCKKKIPEGSKVVDDPAAVLAKEPYKAELRSGKLVVCANCRCIGPDFNACVSCKRKIAGGSKMIDNPESVLSKEPYKAELRSGKLVVCQNCGCVGPDFNMCDRCKKKIDGAAHVVDDPSMK